ncbi:MAG: penicillin acylase family protein [Candidatus Hodarchaeales archaeon]
MDSSRKPRIKRFVGFAVLTLAIVIVISGEIGPFPPFGNLINPHSGLWHVSGNSNLRGREEVIVSGIDAEITVIRDEWGVPHIFSETDNDAYFAIGYCHAQDRLWQMDIQRRQFNGKLSEIIGSAALGADIFYRSIGLGRVAEENWEYIKTHDGSSDVVQAIEWNKILLAGRI